MKATIAGIDRASMDRISENLARDRIVCARRTSDKRAQNRAGIFIFESMISARMSSQRRGQQTSL